MTADGTPFTSHVFPDCIEDKDALLDARRQQEVLLASTRSRPPSVPLSVGLENPIGAHNCFLNVVLQSLWHLSEFREAFQGSTEHLCGGDLCVFCALKSLFRHYMIGSSGYFCHIPPHELRVTVSKVFSEQQRFQLDKMDDAAELLEELLGRLHHELSWYKDVCSPPCAVHRCFGADIIGNVEECVYCEEVPDRVESFRTCIHYIPTTLLGTSSCRFNSPYNPPFFIENRIRDYMESEHIECPTCARLYPQIESRLHIRKFICNTPMILSFVLVWSRPRASKEDLSEKMQNIPLTLKLDEIYRMAENAGKAHRNKYYLRAMVCFYGNHYIAYCYNRLLNSWIYFNDSSVRNMGSWSEAKLNAVEGNHMPLILFYSLRRIAA